MLSKVEVELTQLDDSNKPPTRPCKFFFISFSNFELFKDDYICKSRAYVLRNYTSFILFSIE